MARTLESQIPTVSLKFEREEIPVTMLGPSKVPDRSWRFVDASGHGHFWTKDETLPTLEEYETGETYFVGDETEGYEELPVRAWRCRECREPVEPGYRDEYPPATIPGRLDITVSIGAESYRVSEEDYVDSLRVWAENLAAVDRR